MYTIVVDIGTGSGRSILFDRGGSIVEMSQKEWLPKEDLRYPGSQDFDTSEVWRLLSSSIQEVIKKASISSDDIKAVTSTSMREGMVLYNDKKKVIWACSNVDARARAEVVEMTGENLGEYVYKRGGDWLNIISPARFRWLKKHEPRIYDQIQHMNMISDWFLFELSGNIITDSAMGSSSGIFDLEKRTWSEEIINKTALPTHIYPKVIEVGSVVGTVSGEAAKLTGLKAGTPVVTSGADTQMALAGSGAVIPGKFTICAGTFWQTTLITDYPLIDSEYRLRTLCHAVDKQWMTEGIGFYHGFTMRWFKEGFCQEEIRAARKTGVSAFTLMEEQAEKIPPGSNGVYAVFSNVMNAKKWLHAVPALVGFDVLNPEKTGKAASIRAILESAAYVAKGNLDILKQISGISPDEIVLVGGTSKGKLWPQIISDVLNVSIKIPEVKETTSLGGFLSCMLAIGEYVSWSEAAESIIKWDRTIEPNTSNVSCYFDYFNKWRELYPYMLNLAENDVLPALWRAPGV